MGQNSRELDELWRRTLYSKKHRYNSEVGNLIDSNLKQSKAYFKPDHHSIDLYDKLLASDRFSGKDRMLPTDTYTIKVIEKGYHLDRISPYLDLVGQRGFIPFRVDLVENNGDRTGCEAIMYANTEQNYKVGNYYRVKGNLYLHFDTYPLLGYVTERNGGLLPASRIGSVTNAMHLPEYIAPYYKLPSLPEPRSSEYYEDKFGLGINDSRPAQVDLSQVENKLGLMHQPAYDRLVQYLKYPVIQIINGSKLPDDNTSRLLNEMLNKKWDYISRLVEIANSKPPVNLIETNLKVVFVSSLLECYTDLPTVNLLYN